MAPVFFYKPFETFYRFVMGFTDYIVSLDHRLFLLINGEWSNSFLDVILPFLTDLNRQRWFVPAVLILFGLWIAMKRMNAVAWIVVLVVSIGASDLVSYRVIKSTADRARPQQAGLAVTLRTKHHSGPSFPSNHAANAFAGASVLSAAFPPATPLFLLVAGAIAYSRVYVGVHFPIDVIAGALLGWFIAFVVRLLLGGFVAKTQRNEIGRHQRAQRAIETERRARWMKR